MCKEPECGAARVIAGLGAGSLAMSFLFFHDILRVQAQATWMFRLFVMNRGALGIEFHKVCPRCVASIDLVFLL